MVEEELVSGLSKKEVITMGNQPDLILRYGTAQAPKLDGVPVVELKEEGGVLVLPSFPTHARRALLVITSANAVRAENLQGRLYNVFAEVEIAIV